MVTFYAALHLVDALLAHDKVERVTAHDARNRVLFQTKRYEYIRGRYMPLYDLSRTVRYLASPSLWVPPERVEKDVLSRYLYPIEQSVEKLMGAALPRDKISLPQSATPAMPAPAAPPRARP